VPYRPGESCECHRKNSLLLRPLQDLEMSENARPLREKCRRAGRGHKSQLSIAGFYEGGAMCIAPRK
jgi:hypothetical protein